MTVKRRPLAILLAVSIAFCARNVGVMLSMRDDDDDDHRRVDRALAHGEPIDMAIEFSVNDDEGDQRQKQIISKNVPLNASRIENRVASTMEESEPSSFLSDPVVPFPSFIPRDAAAKSLARRCVRAGMGGVYVKHFRKAAGTTLYRILQQSCKRRIQSYSSELPFFDPRTFRSLGTSVFVTSMRDPIDRILSLYWFEGRWPRTCNRKCEARKVKNDTTKVANLDTWVENVYHQTRYKQLQLKRHNSCGMWQSVENYYTRMLLGMDRSPDATHAGRGYLNITLTREHLEFAKRILESFDLVLITEEMGNPENDMMSMFRHIVGAETTGSETHARKNTDKRNPPSPKVLARLRALNAFDLELYEHAKQLSERAVMDWKTSPDLPMSGIKLISQCHKPPWKLPNKTKEIAIGGPTCKKKRFTYYSGGCLEHSNELLHN